MTQHEIRKYRMNYSNALVSYHHALRTLVALDLIRIRCSHTLNECARAWGMDECQAVQLV